MVILIIYDYFMVVDDYWWLFYFNMLMPISDNFFSRNI